MLGRNPGFVTTQGLILADHLVASGYYLVTCSSKVNRLQRLADVILTILHKRRTIDLMVVEVYSGLSFILADVASILGSWLGIPCIGVLHGGRLPQFSKRCPRWTGRVLKRFDQLVAPSAYLSKVMAVHGLSTTVIPNIVDLGEYPYRLRKKLKPAFLWMRAFHTIYNPEMAVRVLALVLRNHPDATLVMAGVDKGMEDETKKVVRELGLSGAVRFPGFLDHDAKNEEFSRADIYLNTTRIDNMPISVIEACAMGLPVVATNVGGLVDLITDRENGILIGDGNVEQMANAVHELLANPDLAERISRNGQLLAQRSSWLNVCNFWEKVFAEVLDHRQQKDDVVAEPSSHPVVR